MMAESIPVARALVGASVQDDAGAWAAHHLDGGVTDEGEMVFTLSSLPSRTHAGGRRLTITMLLEDVLNVLRVVSETGRYQLEENRPPEPTSPSARSSSGVGQVGHLRLAYVRDKAS